MGTYLTNHKEVKMKRGFGLIRVSSLTQQDNTSLSFQTEQISNYTKMNDIELVSTISDTCSGGFETRDGIEEVKSLILEGKVDVVLIMKVDRCFRSMLGFAKFYKFLEEHKVELISVSEGLSSFNETNSMIFGIMVSVGSYEKSMIRNRVMSGKVSKVKQGSRSMGGKLPFGYTTDTDGEIILEPTESKIVKYIFTKSNKLLKNKKLTPYKRTQRLLKLLKARGFTYTNGKVFRPYHLKTFLNNEFYFGEMKYGEVVVSHNHPKIISKRLFNQIHT